MEHSKVFKRKTYINDNGVKIYAERQLEHNSVNATVVWDDGNCQMMSFQTIWGFIQFVEQNDFQLTNKVP